MTTPSLRLPPAAPRFTLLGVAAALLGGCGLFSVTQHDTFTVEVTATPATNVQVITSDLFSLYYDEQGNETFHLFNGDTTWTSVPFQRNYDLRQTGMFYARTAESEDPDAVITMRVLIDGEERYNFSGVLEGSGVQFFYIGH